MLGLFEDYKPKNYGKEYWAIKGSSTYPMFVTTALGVKPSYDDWIPVDKYDEFLKICKDYGLYVETDVIFQNPTKQKEEIVGGDNINTTFAIGKRFSRDIKEGQVHVFVSKSKEMAKKAKKSGWYPIVIGNRMINKPFIDHLRFGKALGYPDCCVDFFRRFNDWKRFSHPYETLKNTPVKDGRPIGSFYCNNIPMDFTYFYIHQLPCSYRCKATIELAQKVRSKIAEVEPDYVEKTDEILKKPLLVFGEKNFMIFEGKLDDNSINYSDVVYASNPASPEDKFQHSKWVKQGDKIILKNNEMIIMKNNEVIKKCVKKEVWFLINFE